MRTLLCLALSAVLLVSCGSTEDSEPSEPWMEAASYMYTVDSTCGERIFLGTFEITVRDHVVVDAVDDEACYTITAYSVAS